MLDMAHLCRFYIACESAYLPRSCVWLLYSALYIAWSVKYNFGMCAAVIVGLAKMGGVEYGLAYRRCAKSVTTIAAYMSIGH